MNKILTEINNQANIHWNGSFETDQARYEYRSTQFAKTCRPTITNTLCGDVQLPHDLFYRLSFKMPYAYQKAAYSCAASVLGTLAIPGLFVKAMKHLILPGEEGAKVMLARDFRDLTKAVKSAVIGLTLTAVRVIQAIADPLLYIQWKLNSLKLRGEHKNDPDYQKYGQTAYLIIDLQRGFIPVNDGLGRTKELGYGELPVVCLDQEFGEFNTHPDVTENAITNAIELANRAKDTTYVGATLDWHPATNRIEGGHVSFASSHGKEPQKTPELVEANGQAGQPLFPDHCVEDTKGARFVEQFPEERLNFLVQKGNHRKDDSFGGHGGNTKTPTGASVYWTEQTALLKARGVETVFISGLARDYCVNATAAGLLVEAGMNVVIVDDATAGVFETVEKRKELRETLNEKAAAVSKIVEWKTTTQMLEMAPYFERTAIKA